MELSPELSPELMEEENKTSHEVEEKNVRRGEECSARRRLVAVIENKNGGTQQ